MITWIIVFALALLSIVVFVFALRSQQDAEALEDRLAGTIDEEAAAHPHQAGGIEPLPEWIQPAARFGLKLAGNDKSRETTALLLAQAGFARPGSLGVFLLLKTLLGLGIAAALFFGTQERSIGTIALMGAGYFAGGILPEWVLKSMAARRYTALERSMPDALDLMVICAEAGLPFTRIVKVVSRELELSAPVLAHELTLTNAELEIMPERSAALRNLAERTRVPSIEGMVSTLIQAEQFGTPLAQALHNIAAESRSTLILTLEERAGKLPARLSLPLMTLILPPVVAIVAAPALMLSGCASLAGAGSDSPMPERTIKERTPSEVVTAPKKDRESALRLARMLVAQGRYEGALGVYAELDRRGGMDAKTLLEYAGIASLIEPPRATLTLFTRTKALAEAEKVQFSPAEEAGLLTGLGRAYMASARMSDARSALERAVELDDKNVSALNAYGIVLDAAGEHEEAVKYFDKALAQSPTNVQVLNNLALAKLGMNDAKGALKVLGDAENFSSSDASGVLTPKMNLAFVQFMTGSADRSRETLQSFMTNEQAEEALKKFAAMKSRIDAGESTLADECLRAAEKMIEIRPKSADDSDYGYEVPLVVEPVKTIETNGGAGLSSHAQTFPKGSPEAAAALEALKKGSAGQNGSKP